ncbi:hypothetical protein fHeYen902_214 [Yersinia phage fHe-Yen9-02]|nr:hypothetical protein fHeYen902_214 [Yersinia phage fHe-Yen9-02]
MYNSYMERVLQPSAYRVYQTSLYALSSTSL